MEQAGGIKDVSSHSSVCLCAIRLSVCMSVLSASPIDLSLSYGQFYFLVPQICSGISVAECSGFNRVSDSN